MKIALAQTNMTVGALRANARKILEFAAEARKQGADLVVFPELAITGYPPKDLLEKGGFVDESLAVLNDITNRVEGITAIIGFAEPNRAPEGKPFYNAAAVIGQGRRIATYRKSLLPTYDVF